MKKLLLLLIISKISLANLEFNLIPAPPKMSNKSYVLLAANSNKIIAEQNQEKIIEPASLTKLMTLFITAGALKQKTVTLKDRVLISKKAWREPGSRMFVKAGDYVTLDQLIQGSAVVSGNDATVAIAEHIAGSEERFVELMNQTAVKLGMHNTHFNNATGLPAKKHFTTTKDLAILAKAWFDFYPEYTKWFTQKQLSYNKIKQHNRNKLLWSNPAVDGMKTGYTKAAGYCLVSSAIKNGERLIAVIAGAKSRLARFEQSSQLLNFGFHFYETKTLLKKDDIIGSTKVALGVQNSVAFSPDKDIVLTVPKINTLKLEVVTHLKAALTAPIKQGEVIGSATAKLGDQALEFNIVASQNIDKGNIWQITKNYLRNSFG